MLLELPLDLFEHGFWANIMAHFQSGSRVRNGILGGDQRSLVRAVCSYSVYPRAIQANSVLDHYHPGSLKPVH